MKTFREEIEFQCPETPSKCFPIAIHLSPASYIFELWGASGANGSHLTMFSEGGKGVYTKGTIKILESTTLYVYIGGTGAFKYAQESTIGGWNGGGNSTEAGASGGGATDIRYYYSADPLDNKSLESRILVAGGGGGCFQANPCHSTGGDGGGLEGKISRILYGTDDICVKEQLNACYGTQSSCFGGEEGTELGKKGIGGSLPTIHGPGGGDGYWGGGSGVRTSGGGSGYIGGTSKFIVKDGYTEAGVNWGNGKFAFTKISNIIYLNQYNNKKTHLIFIFLLSKNKT